MIEPCPACGHSKPVAVSSFYDDAGGPAPVLLSCPRCGHQWEREGQVVEPKPLPDDKPNSPDIKESP